MIERLDTAASESSTEVPCGHVDRSPSERKVNALPRCVPQASLYQPQRSTCAFATDDPRAFLLSFHRAIIDEVQRVPELPSYLQGIIDAD
jgi:hypothetical protein